MANAVEKLISQFMDHGSWILYLWIQSLKSTHGVSERSMQGAGCRVQGAGCRVQGADRFDSCVFRRSRIPDTGSCSTKLTIARSGLGASVQTNGLSLRCRHLRHVRWLYVTSRASRSIEMVQSLSFWVNGLTVLTIGSGQAKIPNTGSLRAQGLGWD